MEHNVPRQTGHHEDPWDTGCGAQQEVPARGERKEDVAGGVADCHKDAGRRAGDDGAGTQPELKA